MHSCSHASQMHEVMHSSVSMTAELLLVSFLTFTSGGPTSDCTQETSGSSAHGDRPNNPPSTSSSSISRGATHLLDQEKIGEGDWWSRAPRRKLTSGGVIGSAEPGRGEGNLDTLASMLGYKL